MKNYLALLGSVVISASALASVNPPEEKLILGEAAVTGTGCAPGTASAILSPDQETLSLLFSGFVAETTPTANFARSSCNAAVSVKIPAGYTIQLQSVDYRGFANVAPGTPGLRNPDSSVVLNREYFFAGSALGARRSTPFVSSTEFTVTDNLLINAFAPCGGQTILRLNTSISATRPAGKPNSQTSGGVDSIDIAKKYGAHFAIDWIQCDEHGRPIF